MKVRMYRIAYGLSRGGVSYATREYGKWTDIKSDAGLFTESERDFFAKDYGKNMLSEYVCTRELKEEK